MNNIVLMQVLNGMADLSDDTFHFLFIKSSLFLQHIVNVSWITQLQNQINELLLQKVCVKLANVRMVQKWLYFNLSDQLFNNTFLFENFRHSF